MPYVKREYLTEQFEDLLHNDNIMNPVVKVLDALEIIDTAPSADVVEVVRCKDCEYCCISTDPKTNISIQKCGYVGFNPVQSSQVSDDFYCGYGELKEREG